MKRKTKFFIGLVNLLLLLNVIGTTEAVELRQGAFLWKTFNWEVGTAYSGGKAGKIYFRNETTSYYSEEIGFVQYDATNPNHGLFSALTIIKDPSLMADEDSWGLLEMRQLESGDIFPSVNPKGEIGPKSPADIYWKAGVDGVWIRGAFWGVKDQVVHYLSSVDVRIYSSGLKFNFVQENTATWNPQQPGKPAPSDLDRSNPAIIPGWNDIGNVVLEGEGEYFRFFGFFNTFGIPDGDTEIYADVTSGDWYTPLLDEFWDNAFPPDGLPEDPTAEEDGWSHLKVTFNIGDPVSFANGWVGSEDTGKGFISEPIEELECRVTGGGVDEFTGLWDGTFADAKSNNPNGPIDSYRFGGQAGAPTGCQPQPWGEWTHHQQSGPDGSFVFHAGTASAPPGTEIDWIACADPGWCVQARPAPAKQINFTGVGTFKNMKKPSARLSNVVVGKTFHWFEVHIEDLGEPGKGGKVDPPAPQCPPEGSEGELADCACPDFYRITIYEAFYPPAEPNKTTIIYEVYGYIRGGNLQIHPPLPCK